MFGTDVVNGLAPQTAHIGYHVLILVVAALLGAALGIVRPVRREIVPRSAHVIHAQILLSIVGAIIIVAVSLIPVAIEFVKHRREAKQEPEQVVSDTEGV